MADSGNATKIILIIAASIFLLGGIAQLVVFVILPLFQGKTMYAFEFDSNVVMTIPDATTTKQLHESKEFNETLKRAVITGANTQTGIDIKLDEAKMPEWSKDLDRDDDKQPHVSFVSASGLKKIARTPPTAANATTNDHVFNIKFRFFFKKEELDKLVSFQAFVQGVRHHVEQSSSGIKYVIPGSTPADAPAQGAFVHKIEQFRRPLKEEKFYDLEKEKKDKDKEQEKKLKPRPVITALTAHQNPQTLQKQQLLAQFVQKRRDFKFTAEFQAETIGDQKDKQLWNTDEDGDQLDKDDKKKEIAKNKYCIPFCQATGVQDTVYDCPTGAALTQVKCTTAQGACPAATWHCANQRVLRGGN